MKVRQILNNNAVLVKRGGNEAIVLATGIAFRKKVGQDIEDDEIEKIFVPDSGDMLEHFSYLLQRTPPEHLTTVNEIISHAEKILDESASAYMYLALLDHMDYVVKRAKDGLFMESPLAYEVKWFYQKHFEIGLEALGIIGRNLHITIPECEATAFALHFINMQRSTGDMKDTLESMDTVKDIIQIIRYHPIPLSEDSFDFMRLVTHLQFFVKRLRSGKQLRSNNDLGQQVKVMYPVASACVKRINLYIQKQFGRPLTEDEETYLILHIQKNIMSGDV